MFYGCNSLTSVNVSNIKVSLRYSDIGSMFSYCSNLTFIDISSWIPEDSDIIIFDEYSELPLKGKIILRLELYSIIKEQILKGWIIIFAK